MKRPNFDVGLPGSCLWRWDGNTSWQSKTVSDAEHSTETSTGTSRRKPNTRFIPPTAYTFQKTEYRRAYGFHRHYVSGSNWYEYTGYVDASGGINTLNSFNDSCNETTITSKLSSNAALIAARNKMKNGSVNLGVAFAERGRTAQMLGDNAVRLAKAVRSLRRGNFRDAARHLGILTDPGKPRGSNITNHWLQLQYGWKPLLSDVYGACEALSKRPPDDWFVTATAQRNDTDTYYRSTYPTGSDYPNGGFYAYSGRVERRRGVFVRIDAIPNNDLLMSLSSLGVTNPLLVAWELVPFSFVVDWAIPVGDWLNSLDAMLGYGTSYTSTSYWNEGEWFISGNSRKNYNLPKREVINEWEAHKRLVRVERTVNNGVPLPTAPRIKRPESLGHMANGLALLAQAFGRK